MDINYVIYAVVAVLVLLVLGISIYRQKLLKVSENHKYTQSAIDIVSKLATPLVHELESSDLDNAAKKKRAFDTIENILKMANISVPDDVINGYIESAVSAMHLSYNLANSLSGDKLSATVAEQNKDNKNTVVADSVTAVKKALTDTEAVITVIKTSLGNDSDTAAIVKQLSNYESLLNTLLGKTTTTTGTASVKPTATTAKVAAPVAPVASSASVYATDSTSVSASEVTATKNNDVPDTPQQINE